MVNTNAKIEVFVEANFPLSAARLLFNSDATPETWELVLDEVIKKDFRFMAREIAEHTKCPATVREKAIEFLNYHARYLPHE